MQSKAELAQPWVGSTPALTLLQPGGSPRMPYIFRVFHGFFMIKGEMFSRPAAQRPLDLPCQAQATGMLNSPFIKQKRCPMMTVPSQGDT